MSEPEPQRIRVRVEDPTPQPDPARTGCLWVGGILGVIVGVVVTFFAVPSILNFLFPSETIEVGETYEDDKLTIQVMAVERTSRMAETGPNGYAVWLRLHASSSWSPSYSNFVLVLSDGRELDAAPAFLRADEVEPPSKAAVPQGDSELVLLFLGMAAWESDPDSLHLEEPAVKFELPAPVAP